MALLEGTLSELQNQLQKQRPQGARPVDEADGANPPRDVVAATPVGIEPAQVVVMRGHAPVQWVIAAALVVIATCLVLRLDERAAGIAWAQPVSHSGARGVFAFTGQLTKSSFGVFMVDLDASNIWCYEYGGGGKRELELVAARSWKYDRFLDNFNTTPSPEEIAQLVEENRRRALQKAGQSGAS